MILSYIKLFSCTVRSSRQSGSSRRALLLLLLPSLEFFLFVDSLLSLVNLFRLIPANNEMCCLPGFVEFSEDFTPLTEFLAFLSPESSPLFTFSPGQLMVAGEGEEGGGAPAELVL